MTVRLLLLGARRPLGGVRGRLAALPSLTKGKRTGALYHMPNPPKGCAKRCVHVKQSNVAKRFLCSWKTANNPQAKTGYPQPFCG